MSQIELTDVVYYKDGEAGHSQVAGFESGVTRVARYTFVAPGSGATALTVQFSYLSKGAGVDIPLRFAISTDPDSHPNAGEHSPYTGVVDIPNARIDAQVRLIPNQTYYLWVFPGQNMWGWYYIPGTGTVTTSGVAEGVATAQSGVLGLPLDITIHSTPGYTHRLTWQFGDASGIIGEELGDAVTWTPPLELAFQIPTAQSGICRLTCYSFQDGIPTGEPQLTLLTLSVPPGMAPRVTVDLTDPEGALGLYIEKVSRLKVVVSTTLFYSAQEATCTITLDGEAYTGTVLEAGEHTLTVTVTDTRGMVGVWERTFTVEAYTPPRLELHASRCRSDGTLDDIADHALVTVRGSVTALPGNTAALLLTYGKTTQEIPVAVGEFETTAIIPADPNETLHIKARVVDAVKGTTRSMTLSTGYPTMEFFAGGKGIAFGKVADSEGFHCAMDAVFSGRVLDGQGRTLAARYDLNPVTGMYLTVHYGRVLELMGAGFLQLRFTCNRSRSAGDVLFETALPLTEDLTVTDLSGSHTLTLTPTGVTTPQSLPTGTYTFSCLLY